MLWLCTFQMGLIIYVSLLLLAPKILSVPFDPQDNDFLSWAHPAAFHNCSNCWVCGALPSSSWKASCGGHLHFKKKTFSKSANTFDSNHMWCLFYIRWHLPTLNWTGATLCTLTMDIMWLSILTMLPYICNCVTGFVSSSMKAFKLQMVAQTPAAAAPSSTTIWGPWIRYPQYED